MKIININGYYLSEPIPYEDWHAGHKMEHTNFVAYFFVDENRVFKSAKTNENSFSKSDFLINGMEVEYAEIGKTIEFYYDRISKFTKRRIFTILGVDTILDEKSIKYTWTAFPTENI